MKCILIATNSCDEKNKIVEKGIQLGHVISAQVLLLTVIDNSLNFIMPELAMEAISHREEDFKYIKQSHDKIIQMNNDVQIDSVITLGEPKTEIIKQATEKEAAAIVIGTHGKTGISSIFMGSTAEYVIRHSTVPVLVIPLNEKVH